MLLWIETWLVCMEELDGRASKNRPSDGASHNCVTRAAITWLVGYTPEHVAWVLPATLKKQTRVSPLIG